MNNESHGGWSLIWQTDERVENKEHETDTSALIEFGLRINRSVAIAMGTPESIVLDSLQ